MANITETANQFDPGVYQIETNDPVVGGPAGISNKQAINLANRTAFLKAAIDLVIAGEGGTPDNVDPTLLYAAIQSAVASGSTPLPTVVTQAAAEAGVSTTARLWTAERVSQAIAALASSIPVGAAIPFFGGTVHTGFLKANGAAVSRTSYAALFTEIGTLYGAGDGATTFNLPDSRGEFLRGWDDARGIDAGRALGSGQTDSFKSHSHNFNKVLAAAVNGSVAAVYRPDGYSAGSATTTSGGIETRPRNLAVQFLIKY